MSTAAVQIATIRLPRKSKSTTSAAKPSARTLARSHRHAWSHTGVGMCVVMSACLNGYANSMHASIPVAGAILGVMIPCLVFVLCKVAGMQWKSGGRGCTLAYFTAGTGASLLALSIYHCACSLSLLTGSPMWMCVPMAVAIDAGLVACELDIVLG